MARFFDYNSFINEDRYDDLEKMLTKTNQQMFSQIASVDGIKPLLKKLKLDNVKHATDKEAEILANAVNNKQWYKKLPVSYFFDSPPVKLPRTKLIHFSQNGEEIVENGFTRGTPDPNKLGMSWGSINDSPGWNYAFQEKDLIEKYGSLKKASQIWGKDVITFTAPCVKAYHYGDDIEQALFWGKDARDIELIKVEK